MLRPTWRVCCLLMGLVANFPIALASGMGLNALVVTNQREIPAEDYFAGMFMTALEDGEIITHVVFPLPVKAAYAKFSNPASRYAMAGVLVAQLADGSIRVAVTGAGNEGVYRFTALEEALATSWSEQAVEAVTVDPTEMLSDLHGDAAYRAQLVKVLAKRAILAAR